MQAGPSRVAPHDVNAVVTLIDDSNATPIDVSIVKAFDERRAIHVSINVAGELSIGVTIDSSFASAVTINHRIACSQ